MNHHSEFDPDLETFRQSLHKIDDDKIYEVQKRRNRRAIAKNLAGEYSFSRLLHGQRNDRVGQQAPLERAHSDAIAEAIGIPAQPGFDYVPVDGRRDLNAANTGQGGFLIWADTAPGNTFTHFLDTYFPFGPWVQRLTLQRPANFPKISGNVTPIWLANETSTITESNFTFAIESSSTKWVGGYTEASQSWLKSTSEFGMAFVLQALARATARELSRKMLLGSGANGQCYGVYNYPTIGTTSGASANAGLALDMVEDVEGASALLTPSKGAFVMPSHIARLYRGREMASGSGMAMVGNTLAGYPAIVTEAASPNSMVFGDFSQLVLLEYSALQVSTDPYGANSALFQKGLVGLKALWACDIVLLNVPSFTITGALN